MNEYCVEKSPPSVQSMPLFVTPKVTSVALPAIGEVQIIWLTESHTAGETVSPNLHPNPSELRKLYPEIKTSSPPSKKPKEGKMEVTEGER